MEDEMIILTSYTDLQACYHAVSRLEAEGIEAVIYDENFASIVPGVSQVIGGNRICVKASQAENAMKVLKAINLENKKSEEEKELTVMGKVFEKTFGECPKCESENIYTEKLSTFRALIADFRKSEHYCKDCRYIWLQLPDK
jgi:hypothetical protein